MESRLYPMKFMPLFKNKVWGGNRIKSLGFDYSPLPNCGELWALSGVEGNESVVANGFLAENHINELLEIYMGELIGERNYDRFGAEFPLLIKLIDAADKLSIQVHPDDALAQKRGMENGKTEMWYIIKAGDDSEIVDGFERQVNQDEYRQFLEAGLLERIRHVERPLPGDMFFIPAGRVHAIGKDILLAEIPPTADGKTHYNYRENETAPLAECPYFTTNLLSLGKPVRKDFSQLDSFVVYLCVEGVAAVNAMNTVVPLHAGECVLLPAVADTVELFPSPKAKLLEVYIDPVQWKGESPSHVHDYDWLASLGGSEN